MQAFSDQRIPGVLRATAVAVCALVLASAAPASAQQTAAQQKCSASVYKSAGLLGQVFAKGYDACLIAHAKTAFSIPACLMVVPPSTAKTLAKVGKLLSSGCDGTDKDGVSKLPDFGVVTPETTNLVYAAAIAGSSAVGETFGGHDALDEVFADFASNKVLAKCQLAIHKAQESCAATRVATFAACARGGLKGSVKGGVPPFMTATELSACLTADPDGKIAAACAADGGKLGLTLDKKCTAKGIDLAIAAPACGASSLGTVTCIEAVPQCLACIANTSDANLPAAGCDSLCVGIL